MEANYVISSEESSSPGRYSFANYPYLREIFDDFVDDEVDLVVTAKGAQTGWTAGFTGLIGAIAATNPCRILVAMPTENEGEIWSTDRFQPNVQATPSLRALFPKPKERSGGNKILFKRYPGGSLKIIGANSGAGLSSWPPKFFFGDEIDRYPLNVDKEGDPIALARKRIQTWLRRGGKMGLGSTPRIEQTSLIWHYFMQGDQRKWPCTCPHCGHVQFLAWEQLKWDKGENGEHRPETAHYECAGKGCRWSDIDRKRAIRAGRAWVATATAKDHRVRSRHIHGLLSPHVGHVELATKWLNCETDAQRQAFMNLDMGLPWKVKGEAPKWAEIYERREAWPANVLPFGVLFLTIGVDVQKDRLEARIWGWGRGKQSWLIERQVIEGDPAGPEVWQRLTALCERTWAHESGGVLALARVAIDAGYASEHVYAWARKRSKSQVMVVNGRGTGISILGMPKAANVTRRGKAAKAGVRVWWVNSGKAKETFYGWLRLPRALDGQDHPPGYVHFNEHTADDDEIKQHTAEELVEVRGKTGLAHLEWTLMAGRRNEALDCRVYAHAAAIAFGLDNFGERSWSQLEANLGLLDRPLPSPDHRLDATSAPPPAAPPPQPRQRRRFHVSSSF